MISSLTPERSLQIYIFIGINWLDSGKRWSPGWDAGEARIFTFRQVERNAMLIFGVVVLATGCAAMIYFNAAPFAIKMAMVLAWGTLVGVGVATIRPGKPPQ